jgi:2,4-dienoyl-CoA reductase (NADPH2)
MSPADLERVAIEFAVAAGLAREAGFDAVEIHMAHGYLLSQFLSPKYNRRKDRYGGSVERRARFPAHVLRLVLDAVGRDLAVVCKIGATEGFPGGATADESAQVARILQDEGAHLLVLTGGMNVESPWAMFGNLLPQEAAPEPRNVLMRLASRALRPPPPRDIAFREMYQLENALKIRAAVRMPLAYLGGVKSWANIETVMARGFDCVAAARAFIHDAELVNKFRAGTAAQSGCTACNRCVLTMYSPGGTSCVLHEPNDVDLNEIPLA